MREVPAGHPEKPQGADGFKLLDRMNGGSHEELAVWALPFLPIKSDARILDIGCGGGANLERLLQRVPEGHVTGIDYSSVSVQASSEYNADAIAQGRCDVMEGDVRNMPFADDAFDIITAFETVYYWDLPAAFAEVKRVLKPGGIFLVSNEDDRGDPEVLELATKIPGMIIYAPEELEEPLKQAGFAIQAVERKPKIGHFAIIATK
ncbi:MAG: class I SAM-dependent methyltransferase [Eggerthellaceae bacterium]|nr:class I SAM-dependent methyltransferase [Eggerthellaceae bacterium]